MIRILHGADLHLDSPFSEFSPEAAAEYRALQRQLPGKLTALCRNLRCDMLLLAGDVFDAIPYPETVELLRQELALCPVPVFLVPGNHDPLESGLWDGDWPEHVHILKEPGCVTLEELGCCIHHGGAEDLRAPKDGFLHIGLLHGDARSPGFGHWPSEREIAATGLHYLALGHIHKSSMPRKAGDTWYGWPGIPMGRGFDETGKRGVFCVELSQQDCRAEQVILEGPRYEVYFARSDGQWEPPEDSEEIHARLYLTGTSGELSTALLRRRYEPFFLSLEVFDETQPPRDLWEACGDGTLRGLALDVLKAHDDPLLAELSAQFLLAALEGREAP